MTSYLYTWDPPTKAWYFNDILDTEEQARRKGRELWRAGAAGIKIVSLVTVVENKRD